MPNRIDLKNHMLQLRLVLIQSGMRGVWLYVTHLESANLLMQRLPRIFMIAQHAGLHVDEWSA